jgi:hypothetical protein
MPVPVVLVAQLVARRHLDADGVPSVARLQLTDSAFKLGLLGTLQFGPILLLAGGRRGGHGTAAVLIA